MDIFHTMLVYAGYAAALIVFVFGLAALLVTSNDAVKAADTGIKSKFLSRRNRLCFIVCHLSNCFGVPDVEA